MKSVSPLKLYMYLPSVAVPVRYEVFGVGVFFLLIFELQFLADLAYSKCDLYAASNTIDCWFVEYIFLRYILKNC